MYRINIDWEAGTIDEEVIEESPIWRNVTISRDGRRVAAVTDDTPDSDIDNLVHVFDFVLEEWRQFELFNPTFTEGITTGAVEFVDAMEFDFSGESIMYDAYNSIESSFGSEELNYWDIGFLKVWENDINFWEQDTENNIRKLYSGLPQDDSVGNPTFSKNSPDVIAFDYILNFNTTDPTDDIFFLLGANILTSRIDTIFPNGILNFPSFSRTDQQIIFNAETSNDNRVIATIDLADNKISPRSEDASILINQDEGAQLGVWFSNGIRSLSTSTNELEQSLSNLQISPNPFSQQLSIEFGLEKNQDLTLEIINLVGQQVFHQFLTGAVGDNQVVLPLSNLQAGSYRVNLTSDEGVISRQIVKL